jgi:hypothetical protein
MLETASFEASLSSAAWMILSLGDGIRVGIDLMAFTDLAFIRPLVAVSSDFVGIKEGFGMELVFNLGSGLFSPGNGVKEISG